MHHPPPDPAAPAAAGPPCTGPEPIAIRAAVGADAAAIAAVQVASWQAAYAHRLPAAWLSALSVPDRQATWSRVLVDGGSSVAVAVRGGQVVGFVSVGPSRDADATPGTHEVYALYVHPAHWGGGHGRGLWAWACAAARAAGAGQLTLWVIVGHARGVRFYEGRGCRCEPAARQGFEIAGVPLQEDRYRLALAV